MTFLYFMVQLRKERSLNFKFVICDFHDETVTECPSEEVDATVQLIKDALAMTNEELGGEIALSGEPEICDVVAEFKIEGYKSPQ